MFKIDSEIALLDERDRLDTLTYICDTMLALEAYHGMI